MFCSFARFLLFCELKNGAVLTFCCAFILISFALKIYRNLVDWLVNNMPWFGRWIRLISSQFACNYAAISSFFVGLSRTFLPILVQFRKRFLRDTFDFLFSFIYCPLDWQYGRLGEILFFIRQIQPVCCWCNDEG